MDYSQISELIRRRFPFRWATIDSHTAGEPTRLIVGGLGSVPGATITEKRLYFMEHLDHIRLQLTREPRGHRDMFTALLTEPTTKGADFGLIYMDGRRYPYLCGHATIGAVMTLIEAGFLTVQEDVKRVLVDTPSGPMEAVVYFEKGKVESVAIQMVPSFVHAEGEILHVSGFGKIIVDTVCVGGFFAMVSAEQVGLELVPDNCQKLIQLGMDIISAANQQLEVHHPTRPEVNTVDVTEFYNASGHSEGRGSSVVIYGEAHMDRSPCGTGTAAKMTLFHQRGQLELNRPYYNNSPLGTTFQGRLVSETSVGGVKAVIAEIRGSAHITGVHEFILDPRDPFPEGFLI
ncbi:MAG: proline racemase family protein [Desulfobacterales bacterium]|nr:MAG: proline racemase family protein [Desulfobacterales bacterium]